MFPILAMNPNNIGALLVVCWESLPQSFLLCIEMNESVIRLYLSSGEFIYRNKITEQESNT